MGYRIAEDSPALARPATELPLPLGVQLAAVLRGQGALRTDQAVEMQIGDAVDLADVQLVVREMDGAKISKVGLKLMPTRRQKRLR